MKAVRASAAVLALTLLCLVGCGASGSDEVGDPLTVSAAASLTDAFPAYAESSNMSARFSFAGSDELAAQIRQGAPVDVFAAANSQLPDDLYAEGLVERPVVFATNSLVIAVPSDSEIQSLEDLAEPGIDLVTGTEDVPFGSYTRETLDRLPTALREPILANVRSEESDVKAAVGKLTQGAADAAFTYSSDVAVAADRLRAIRLPKEYRPDVAYGVVVVKGSGDLESARSFVVGLTSATGRSALRIAGFKAPPGG